jgi:preprotein translocase subunit SecA
MKFIKENFNYHGGYLTYSNEEYASIFIGRFKYNGPVKYNHMITAVKNNFSVEEWIEAMKETDQNPTEAIEKKIPNWSAKIVAKWKAREEAKHMKRFGRPIGVSGKDHLIIW